MTMIRRMSFRGKSNDAGGRSDDNVHSKSDVVAIDSISFPSHDGGCNSADSAYDVGIDDDDNDSCSLKSLPSMDRRDQLGSYGTMPTADASSSSSSTSTTNLALQQLEQYQQHEQQRQEQLASFAAAMTELQCELRDKVIECEALYETAAALSQGLQESDRRYQLERLKNERLRLKLSMVCRYDPAFFHDVAEDDDEINHDESVQGSSKKSKVDRGDNVNAIDEDDLTSELHRRAEELSISVMKSSSSKHQNRIAALNIQKHLKSSRMPPPQSPKLPLDRFDSNTSNDKCRSKSAPKDQPSVSSTPVDLDVDPDSEDNNTGNSNQPETTPATDNGASSTSSDLPSTTAERREHEGAKREVTSPKSSSLQRTDSDDGDDNGDLSNGVLENVPPPPFDNGGDSIPAKNVADNIDTAPQGSSECLSPDQKVLQSSAPSVSANEFDTLPKDVHSPAMTGSTNSSLAPASDAKTAGAIIKTTKVEKPTTLSLPCQANFYQIILERDIAQTHARKLSKELKMARMEMRQLKSRLDVSTALVEISYSESDNDPKCVEDTVQEERGPATSKRTKKISSNATTMTKRGVGWIRNGSRKQRQPKQVRQCEPSNCLPDAEWTNGSSSEIKAVLGVPDDLATSRQLEEVAEISDEDVFGNDEDDSGEYMKAIASNDADAAGGVSFQCNDIQYKTVLDLPSLGRVIM